MTEIPPPPPEQPEGIPTPSEPAPTGYDPTAAGAAYGFGGPAETVEVAPAGGGRRGLVIGAVAAVLAVLAGAAVYAATVLSGGGMQPDALVPKTAFAFAKVDLDPAAGQKLAARSFFSKFPNLKDKLGGEDENAFEKVLEQLINDDPNVDYKTDIAPWFDRRAAVAGFPGADHRPVVVSVLRSKDDAKARVGLDKINAKAKADGGDAFAYEITKGYVVLSDTQAHVDAAISGSADASLSENENYQNDVDALTGDQVAVAWADIQGSYQAATADVPQAGLVPSAVTDRIKGRVVAGVHFTGDYAELEGKAFGVDERLIPAGKEQKVLAKLPVGTLAAFSVSGLRKSVEDAADLTGLTPDAIGEQLLGGTGLSFSDDVLPLLGDQTVVALGGLPEDFFFSLAGLKVGIVSNVADPAKAKSAGQQLVALLASAQIEGKATVVGDTFVLATPGEYADQLARSTGGLTTSSKFTKAIGDLGTPSQVVYVDLQAIIQADAGAPESAFRSFGMVAGFENGVGYFRARLVVG